jgi:hypothetical protein
MITPRRRALVPTTAYALALAALGLLGGQWSAAPAQAQQRGEVTVDVERCLDIEAGEERQACFAAQVDQVLQQRGEASASAEARENVQERERERERERKNERANERTNERENERERERQVERDSRSRESSASNSRAGRAAADDEADDQEYFGKVVEIREYKPSAYIITLDNGQVWQQTEPKRYSLRPGLEVKIYPTQWGDNYRMSGVNSGGHIQVKRLR